MRQMLRYAFFAILLVLLTNSIFSGCTAPCTYPDQRGVKIRVFNAMPDEENITVFINGKLFVKNFSYDPSNTFGYLSTYADGTPLTAGSAIPVVISSDTAGKNIIMNALVDINFHLQSLIVMGKAHKILSSDVDTRKVLRLEDDNQIINPSITFMRFVHAVPDLPALDVYWNQPDGSPNATILYGMENPYMDLSNADSLKITEAGRPNNVIFSIPTKPTPIPGLVVTAIVRGESRPYGTERTVSTFVLSDGTSGIGNFILHFETFGLRLVNASRSITSLNLLIQGMKETSPRGNYPNQTIVENIGIDSVSKYLALFPSNDSNARYWFSADMAYPNIDTLLGFNSPIPFSKDSRHTIIAVENKKLNETGRSLDTLILLDSRDSMTVQSGKGRVRVIHLSPDHTKIGFTLGGRTVNMMKKQVEFFDVPAGMQNITLSDGPATKTISFNVPLGRPISLYLLPDTQTTTFPILTSQD